MYLPKLIIIPHTNRFRRNITLTRLSCYKSKIIYTKSTSLRMFRYIKYIFTANNIYEAVHPLLTLTHLLGMSPYKFIIEQGQPRMVIVIPWLLWSLFIQLLYTASVIIVTIRKENLTTMLNLSVLHQIGDILRVQLGFIMVVVMGLSTLINFKCYPNILQYMIHVENLMIEMDLKKNYSKYKSFHIVCLLTFLSLQFIYTIFSIRLIKLWDLEPSFYFSMAMYTPGVVAFLASVMYCSLVITTTNSFNQLNSEIRRMCKNKFSCSVVTSVLVHSDELKKTFNKSPDPELMLKIMKIWKIYEQICDMCDVAEKSFSTNVLAIFLVSFVGLVFNEFQVLNILYHIQESEKNYAFLWFCIHQIILHVIMISPMIFLIERFKNVVSSIIYSIIHFTYVHIFISHWCNNLIILLIYYV